MLLEQLVDYAVSLEDTGPPMYQRVGIRSLISLDTASGTATLIMLSDGRGKKPDRGLAMFTPTLVKTVGIKAKLLADNAEYVLGWSRGGADAAKVAKRHTAFIDRVRRCAEDTREPSVRAVLEFLELDRQAQLEHPDDFDPSANMTFRVDGVFPTDLPAVRDWWAAEMAPDDERSGQVQCLVCGRRRPAVERLQFKIKGIRGGQAAGKSLISANSNAFESYGLEASRVAPICSDCAERFSKGLNQLISNEKTHLYVDDVVYVFWAPGSDDVPLTALLSRPDPTIVRGLYENVYRVHQGSLRSDMRPFYGVALAASGGRVAVRDWIDTTIGNAQEHLVRWFQRQQIAAPDGGEARLLSIRALTDATRREESRNAAPPYVSRALFRAALTGGPLPVTLISLVVGRIGAVHEVSAARAALIKLVLLSNRNVFDPEEDPLVELNEHEQDSAYLCGRLLAELDAVQRAALGQRNATIIDRFYGTASSAPASVFGRLLRGAQPHLARLRRDRPGAYIALERRMEEIMSGLPVFPRTLSMEEQGMFALGYYHQRSADAKARLEHSQANQTTTDESTE